MLVRWSASSDACAAVRSALVKPSIGAPPPQPTSAAMPAGQRSGAQPPSHCPLHLGGGRASDGAVLAVLAEWEVSERGRRLLGREGIT